MKPYEKWIDECMGSVAAQENFRNFENIVTVESLYIIQVGLRKEILVAQEIWRYPCTIITGKS